MTSVFFINSTNEIFLDHFFIIKLNLYSIKFYTNHIFTINLSRLHGNIQEKNLFIARFTCHSYKIQIRLID